MSALLWLALAGAGWFGAGPARSVRRIATLRTAGRLGPVARGAPPPGVRRPLARAGPAGLLGAAGALSVGAVALIGGVVLAAALAAVLGTAGRVVAGVMRQSRVAARRAQLLAALRVLIAELEAGSRPATALSAAGAAGPSHATAFERAAAAAARGADAGPILAADPDTALIGHAWQLGEQTGLALAAVLARVSTDIEAVDDQRRAVAVALAGPRSSAILLTGLPLVGIGLGAAMGAQPLRFLVGPGPGRVVALVGVLFDVAGVLWMRRILARAQEIR